MGIIFFCRSCGSRFEVDPRLAGKRARCKKCGQMMIIPNPAEIASMAGIPALAGAASGRRPEPAVSSRSAVKPPKTSDEAAEGPPVEAWIGSAPVDVPLAPLTADQIASPFGKQQVFNRNAVDDDLGDGKPYLMVQPVKQNRGNAAKPVSGMKMLYRKELGGLAKIFREINEMAYLVSVPFLMVLLLGILTKSHSTAVLGATAVVLLNISRLVTGLANLVVVPFRESMIQGLLFLIPPITLIYLNQHWKIMKKPTMRVAGPSLTILAVVAAFTFVPSLSRGKTTSGSVVERLEAGAASLENEIKGEVAKAKTLDVGTLRRQAAAGLKSIEEKAVADGNAAANDPAASGGKP